MYCDDTKYLSGAMPQSEYPFCVQNVDALNQRDAQWSEIKEYLAQDENRNKLDVILGFVPDEESDKTLILHSIEEKKGRPCLILKSKKHIICCLVTVAMNE